jgi:hypothetical protein
VGYRHWPPDPSEPPGRDSDPWTTGGYQHGEWSTQHGTHEYGSHRHDDQGAWSAGHGAGYPYGTDPEATYIYPAVPPTSPRRAPRRQEPDDDPADDPGWMPALAWTAGLFVVPVLLYLLWAATRAGEAAPGCIDSSGAPCDSPRAEALAGIANILPSLAGALTLALLATLGLRRIAATWRSSTVAFAASVIGAGTATLIASLLS